MERSDIDQTDQDIDEATAGRSSEHERRVVEEREDERTEGRGDWPGEPGDPPGAARTDDPPG